MKTTKEMIEVMQAYERGDEIETCISGEQKKWFYNKNPAWNWEKCDYRVKPKFVPFDTPYEFFAAQRKHGRGIIAFGELYTDSYVDCYCNVFLYEGSKVDNYTFNFETLFENCTFEDGTTCGKEIEL